MSGPKVAVLGAGALGSFFGGMMAAGGVDVTLIDLNLAHFDAIRRDGLCLTVDGATILSRPKTCLPAEADGLFDVILLLTKSMHSVGALAGIARCIGPETCLLSLQNGLGNEDPLLAYAPPERVYMGVTTYPADMEGPGRVAGKLSGTVRMAPLGAGPADTVEGLFKQAGLTYVADPHVQVAIWEKVAFNAALNSLCAVTGQTVGSVGAHPDLRALAFEVIAEATRTAHAAGIMVDADRIKATVVKAMAEHLNHRPSMLQDIAAGRPTEVNAITGGIVARAEALGIDTPVCRTLLGLVRGMEAARTNIPPSKSSA